MARFEIFLKPSTVKDIEAISRKRNRQRIVDRIQRLSEDPRPAGSQKLSGRERYRIRQGQYRIIYSIENAKLIVYVIKVGHRKDVYRGAF